MARCYPPIWLIDRSGRTKSTLPIRCPPATGVGGHELEESHPDALAPPERREVDALAVVHAADHDTVDLHRTEARVERGVDSRQDPVELVTTGEGEEHLGAQRVERD